MSYIAFLCYRYDEDGEEVEPIIKFEEPEKWTYQKIIPIQFSVLHTWTGKDERLYK